MNEYDSDRMQDLLNLSHGFETVKSAEEADLILLNTCSIREKAQEKVFHQLGRWKKLKEKNPDLKIGVGGCVASQEGAKITKRAPYVDLVFGPQTVHRVPTLYENTSNKDSSVIDISFPKTEKFENLPEPTSEGPSAFVSIMEGCNKYCSFCVVPHTRGNEISRPLDSIIEEIISLSLKGIREIVLLGQNVNSYRDSKLKTKGLGLSNLIRAVADVEGIDRVSFTTSHPFEFGQDLIDIYTEVPELISHVHLPVQSGSNNILKAMRRRHTRDEYIETINKLKEIRPGISISSDFIVGFPGETEEDFNATKEAFKESDFAMGYIFKYSERSGTPAAQLEDKVPQEIKEKRNQELLALLDTQSIASNRKLLGLPMEVLVEGRARKGEGKLMGRTRCYRKVIFEGSTNLIGSLVDVHIKDVSSSILKAIEA